MTETNCCGNCQHHKPMAQDEFMCDNENSEGYGLSTAYDDCCEEFEGRGKTRMSEFDFSNREMVLQKLKELKERNIPKMSLEKLLKIDGYKWLRSYADKATEEEKKKADEELSKYCERGYNENKDIFSDEECCFYWGLRHGEMVTDDNGMNRTFYHYLTLEGEKHRVEMLLQYHPDCYEIEESEEENENNN